MSEKESQMGVTRHPSLLVLGGGRNGCDRAVLGGEVEEDRLQYAEVDSLGALSKNARVSLEAEQHTIGCEPPWSTRGNHDVTDSAAKNYIHGRQGAGARQ